MYTLQGKGSSATTPGSDEVFKSFRYYVLMIEAFFAILVKVNFLMVAMF